MPEPGSVPFTLENIREAYRATGAEPVMRVWYSPAGRRPGSDRACGCPIGVFLAYHYGEPAADLTIIAPGAWGPADAAARMIGKPYDFVVGFTDGVDTPEDRLTPNQLRLESVRFGILVKRAIFGPDSGRESGRA